MGKCIITRRGGGIEFPVKYFTIPVYGNQVQIPVDMFPDGSSGAALIPWGNGKCVFIRFSVQYWSAYSAVVASVSGYLASGTDSGVTALRITTVPASGAYYPINLTDGNGTAISGTAYAGKNSGFAIKLS